MSCTCEDFVTPIIDVVPLATVHAKATCAGVMPYLLPTVRRIIGRCYRTVSRPYTLGVVIPSATTGHTVQSGFSSGWGGLPSVRISSINIPAPFVDITVHIIQSPRVRLELIHPNRLPSIGSASFTLYIRVTAVPVRLFHRNIVSGTERRCCPRAAGMV